ncbi:MAG: hypothetical protein KDB90_12040, partial [Planctomycetes bacterium]|nr:hypothetical protein [Planctomycetota bacterium]
DNNGDVVGPGSATDNAIARYDLTSGKLIQNSGVLIDDSANVKSASSITFNEQASAPLPISAGEGMFWSKADTPTSPYFTDDAATDHQLMAGDNNLSEITNAATARSNIGAGTGDGDMLGSNNLSDLSSDDTSIVNLIGGATQESAVGGAGPNLAGLLALRNSASAGRSIQLQYLFNAVANLANGTLNISSSRLPFHQAATGTRYATPQQLFNLFGSLASVAPVYNDLIAAWDASGSAAASISYVNLIGASTLKSFTHTGTGSSGATLTLTGINRAHVILVSRQGTTTQNRNWGLPRGSTGNFNRTSISSGSVQGNGFSLDAPASGSSQVLTFNTNSSDCNGSGVGYDIIVWGTPI